MQADRIVPPMVPVAKLSQEINSLHDCGESHLHHCDPSRLEPETEYELSSDAYKRIISHFGRPEIDLFATRSNAKCERFVSSLPDPDSIAIDAFTLNWGSRYFYAFPPFACILRMLRNISS